MALSVDIGANTRAAQAGVRDLSKALDATADSLDDIARDGDRAGDQLERSFRDMVADSSRASGSIARDHEAAAKDVARAYDRAGDDGAAAFDKVKGGAGELQSELGQNLGSAVSTVRGDLTELGQVGQDTLGGLAATLASAGPAGIVGAAAVAAGAVGLGLVTAELEAQKEQAEELRNRLSGAYSEAATEGRDYLSVQQLIAEASDLMFNPERAEEYKRIREDARRLGLDEVTVIDANTGSLEAQEQVLDRINQLIEEQNAKPRQDGFMGTAEWDEEMSQLEGVRDRWTAANDVAEQYAENARTAAEQAAQRHQKERDQIKRTADAAQQRYEGLAELYGKPVTQKVRVDVDSSALDTFRRGVRPITVQADVVLRPGQRAFG